MLTMSDDTTLTNPSVPRYSPAGFKEDTLPTNFIQIAGSLFKGKDESRQTKKIRADLVRDYIARPDSETTSIFQKIIHYLKS